MNHTSRYLEFIKENFEPNFDQLEGLDKLKTHLEENGIDTSKWGTGSSKTLYHLYLEIESGETIINKVGSRLIREVSFIGGIIIHKKDSGGWLRLKEEKQVFIDGRIRRREKMPYGLAEKFKSGEDHKEVVIRGVKEELNIDVDNNQIKYFNKTILHEKNSGDYPNLMSKHIGYEYLIEFNKDQFDENGYIEKQVDKSVYFKWVDMY